MLNVIKRHLNMNKNSEFARFLGISSQAVSNWYSRNTFDAELLYTKCDFINPDWLLTGRGSMLKSEEVSLMGGKETGKEEALPEVNYEYKGAPYYNVDFIGGFDLVLNDQTRNPDYYINFAPYNKEGVIWCNITGHSMEPELNNGDFIAMKEMHSPIQYLPAGEIYGIITEDYRTVKRIRMADQKGFVRLIPTNKSPEYAEQEIPVEMIRKVYAVLGSMHRLF
ncbi:S24 family peptidase [uncultured Parabacteroides sp.]|uniref:LexA family transcriptional regulator n=1 Tax=uncultured Parabacteroides sp. TaxID=512312 RepID=UPI0025D5428A|nr:S24 family peptidase [uncultured Parabacteroides sp.]